MITSRCILAGHGILPQCVTLGKEKPDFQSTFSAIPSSTASTFHSQEPNALLLFTTAMKSFCKPHMSGNHICFVKHMVDGINVATVSVQVTHKLVECAPSMVTQRRGAQLMDVRSRLSIKAGARGMVELFLVLIMAVHTPFLPLLD